MSLGIAAECRRGDRIILGFDWSSETAVSRAEIQPKLATLDYINAPVLFAGTASRAFELMDVIGDHLKGSDKDHPLEALRESIAIQKRALADEYVGSRIGQTYAWFLANGKNDLHPDIWRKMSQYIAELDLDCSAIIVLPGSEGMRMKIFRIHSSGMVEPCEHFCAIGSGLEMAESMLFYRSYSRNHRLPLALYKVQEAGAMGAHAPGVGEVFTVLVANLERNGMFTYQEITREFQNNLQWYVWKYGPQKIGKIDMDADCLMESCMNQVYERLSKRQKQEKAKSARA